jgi:hypothetical protein
MNTDYPKRRYEGGVAAAPDVGKNPFNVPNGLLTDLLLGLREVTNMYEITECSLDNTVTRIMGSVPVDPTPFISDPQEAPSLEVLGNLIHRLVQNHKKLEINVNRLGSL